MVKIGIEILDSHYLQPGCGGSVSHRFGFSEAANLAVHSCALIASSRTGAAVRAHEIAEALGVSESHLRKVLQTLVRMGILTSVKGAAGGFGMAVPAASISLKQIIEAIDSRQSPGGCLLGAPVCPAGRCVFTELTGKIVSTMDECLSATTLESFACALPGGGGGRE